MYLPVSEPYIPIGKRIKFSVRFRRSQNIIPISVTHWPQDIFKILDDWLEGGRKKSAAALKHEIKGNHFRLEVDWDLDGGLPCSWAFKLLLAPAAAFYEAVTKGLVSCLHTLLEERRELFKIVRDKDLEIEEYVNTGVKLSRPALKTQWFRPEEFEKRPVSVAKTLGPSSIETVGSEECNRLMEKVAAAVVAPAANVDTTDMATQVSSSCSDDGTHGTDELNIPEPTLKRKLDKSAVTVSKKSSAQKKLMKL